MYKIPRLACSAIAFISGPAGVVSAGHFADNIASAYKVGQQNYALIQAAIPDHGRHDAEPAVTKGAHEPGHAVVSEAEQHCGGRPDDPSHDPDDQLLDLAGKRQEENDEKVKKARD